MTEKGKSPKKVWVSSLVNDSLFTFLLSSSSLHPLPLRVSLALSSLSSLTFAWQPCGVWDLSEAEIPEGVSVSVSVAASRHLWMSVETVSCDIQAPKQFVMKGYRPAWVSPTHLHLHHLYISSFQAIFGSSCLVCRQLLCNFITMGKKSISLFLFSVFLWQDTQSS